MLYQRLYYTLWHDTGWAGRALRNMRYQHQSPLKLVRRWRELQDQSCAARCYEAAGFPLVMRLEPLSMRRAEKKILDYWWHVDFRANYRMRQWAASTYFKTSDFISICAGDTEKYSHSHMWTAVIWLWQHVKTQNLWKHSLTCWKSLCICRSR